jgi:hypothetical protein
MRWFFVGLVWCASALGAAESPVGIEKILAYKGTWKIETEMFNTRFSKAAKESSTLRNDCWRSAGFFVCDQFVNGESRDLIVFSYDARDDTYNSYSVPAAGGQGSNGKLLIKGNQWTFPWERKEDGRTIYFHVVNVFIAPGAIQYRQEFSEDNVNWTVTAKGLEHKLEKAR